MFRSKLNWSRWWAHGPPARFSSASRRRQRLHSVLNLEELESRQVLSAGDSLATAIPLALNSQLVMGIISSAPTYYAVTVSDAGRLVAQLTPTDGNTRLSLLSPDGQVLMQSDGISPTNGDSLIDLHLAGSAAGTTYYLQVQGLATGAGMYSLVAGYVTTIPPDERLPVGAFPWAIKAADLNGDGKMDLAVASYYSGTVSVYLGSGDGTFLPGRQIAVGPGLQSLVAADFTNDGILDLAVGSIATNTIFILAGNGDDTFQPSKKFSAGGAIPEDLAAGDFNGDGLLDLAVANLGSNQVAVLQNLGHGSFSTPAVYAVGDEPYAIVTGDFNNDSRLDLAVTNFRSNTVSILLGTGDGTFTAATTCVVGTGPKGLVAGHFRGTNTLDLAVADFSANTLSILFGRGDGTFLPQLVLAAGVTPTSVVAADFNDDGQLDLASANTGDQSIEVFFGHNDGTFTAQAPVAVGAAPSTLAVAAFTQDGAMDFAFPDLAASSVIVILGNGNGTFHAPAVNSPMPEVTQVIKADFNHDGVADLAMLNAATTDVTILLGQGDGTFHYGGNFSTGQGGYGLAVADLDGDNNLDLIMTSYTTSTISVLMGQGDGTFGPLSSFSTGLIPWGLVVGDFDDDGKVDVATTDLGSGQVSILFGDGHGRFASPVNYLVGANLYGIAAADFNRDGHLDLAVSGITGGSNYTVSILINDGQGQFLLSSRLSTGADPYGVTAADFDGDGNVDLAVANSGAASMSVYLGNGHGGFSGPFTFNTGVGPRHLFAADFNGDGVIDIASVNYNSSQVGILLGNGDGTFRPGQQICVGLLPRDGAVGDFTGDGTLDVATANSQSGDVSILIGNGDGTFETPRGVASARGPVAITRADFNSDGYIDLATVNSATGRLEVSLGQGDGTFQSPVSVAVGNGPDAVAMADINEDGRPDLSVANFLDNTVSLLFGLGDGTFQNVVSLPVGNGPDALAVGDFNRDGHVDLIVANYLSGDISVLLSRNRGEATIQVRYSVGEGPCSLAMGDVNGDGVTDLVIANALSRNVSILLGRGDGTFRTLAPVALGVSPESVVTGDFNSDGKMDVAVASQGAGGVFLLSGRGDGTFLAPQRVASLSAPIALTAGDFNNDGRPDLAVADYNANTVTVLMGQGDGTFLAQAPFNVGAYPLALVAGDFNNDGRLDFVTANGLGVPVSVALGFGNGEFVEPGASLPPIQCRPIIADLNLDGIPDVIALRSDGKVLFRPGEGNGLFGTPVIVNPTASEDARDITVSYTVTGMPVLVVADARINSVGFYIYAGGRFLCISNNIQQGVVASHLAFGDVNADGLEDLVMSVGDTGEVRIYLQRPNDNMANRPRDYGMTVGHNISSLAVADLNGDGLPEVIATDQSSGLVHVLLNSSTTPFTSQLQFRAGAGLSSATQLNGTWQVQSQESPVAQAVADFNADGTPDLAIVNQGMNRVDLLFGDGQGGVYNPSSATSLRTGFDPVAIVTADFNKDGHADLAVLNKDSADISVFLGDGHGGFTERPRVSAGNNPTGLTVCILEADGDKDLVVSNVQGDVLVIEGNGDGTFQPYQRVNQHMALAAADLNGDGRDDLIFANESLDRVSITYAQAGQSFVQDRNNGILAPGAVVVSDLNRDGLRDLIVANSGSNDIMVYLGIGGGQFAAARSFFAGTNPTGVTIADANGDGIPDIAVSNTGSNDVSVLLGVGQGSKWTLTPGPRLVGGLAPVSTTFAHGNADSTPDLIVCNSESNNVYLLHGLGNGFFDDHHPLVLETGQDPVKAFVGNFGGGHGRDLVVLNAGSNTITLYPNFAGPGHTIGSGGLDPVAAVMGDFNHDGYSDLIVANQGSNNFVMFVGDAFGMHMAASQARPDLSRPTDLIVASLSETSVGLYVAASGREVVYMLTFAIYGSSVPMPVSPGTSLAGVSFSGSPMAASSEGRGSGGLTFIADLSTPLSTSSAAAPARSQVTQFAAVSDSAVGMVATVVSDSAPDGSRVEVSMPVLGGDLRDRESVTDEVQILNNFLMGLDDVPPMPEAGDLETGLRVPHMDDYDDLNAALARELLPLDRQGALMLAVFESELALSAATQAQDMFPAALLALALVPTLEHARTLRQAGEWKQIRPLQSRGERIPALPTDRN
jgi:hypothetical protein